MKKNFIKHVLSYFNETQKFLDVKDTEDRIFRVDGEELTEGQKITEILEDGSIIDVPTSTIELQDGTTLEITDSIISTITAPDAAPVEEPTTTDIPADTTVEMGRVIAKYTNGEFAIIKEKIEWEYDVNETTFEIGTKVTITDSIDGNTYPMYAGTFELEDGRMITLDSEGIVVLITGEDGVVIEAPAVGEDVSADSTEDVPMTEEETAAFAKFDKLTSDFADLQVKYAELEAKYKELGSKASASHTSVDNFRTQETNKPLSPLHSMLRNK